MPRFGPMSQRELIVHLRALGFDEPYAGTRLEVTVRGDTRVRIPNPHEGDIATDLLGRMLRQAGISRQEWESG